MDKGTQVEQIYRLTPLLHQAGLQVGFFIQFGYPGEEREDIEKTLAMLGLCQPDDIGISVSYPLPGTRFYEAVRSQLGERQNWENSSDLAMFYQGPFSTEFYRQLYGVAHKEFKPRKLWKALRGSFKRDHAHLLEDPLPLPGAHIFQPGQLAPCPAQAEPPGNPLRERLEIAAARAAPRGLDAYPPG